MLQTFHQLWLCNIISSTTDFTAILQIFTNVCQRYALQLQIQLDNNFIKHKNQKVLPLDLPSFNKQQQQLNRYPTFVASSPFLNCYAQLYFGYIRYVMLGLISIVIFSINVFWNQQIILKKRTTLLNILRKISILRQAAGQTTLCQSQS